ncbi:hypothetical protein Ahy_B06g084970 isoform A [Arachis hypogaea]|uniref:Uncharacterized protein n=1 Tax=Arachis hypogaea TaxID=3818 RepID=A0A444YT64_ARAHY|nr:hypothetical protein Ahy_B06g084970 isoform A [Arachis hypogaea]
MASEEESFAVLVHHRGSIKRKTRSGVKFTDKNPLYIVVNRTTSYDDLVRSVLMKLGLEGAKRIKKFFYRIPVTILHDMVKYDCLTIGSDEDLQVMFLCRRQFPEVRGSSRNTTNVATAAGSSSMAAVASSSVPVYEPAAQLVASPSFAVDLNDGVRDEVGSFDVLPNPLHGVPPVGVGDGELGDPDEDDVEPETIEDDSGDEVSFRSTSKGGWIPEVWPPLRGVTSPCMMAVISSRKRGLPKSPTSESDPTKSAHCDPDMRQGVPPCSA